MRPIPDPITANFAKALDIVYEAMNKPRCQHPDCNETDDLSHGYCWRHDIGEDAASEDYTARVIARTQDDDE